MILTVCQYGHSRSVAAVRELHQRGIEAIACGVGTAGRWLPFLCQKADRIIIMDECFRAYIPSLFRDKVVACDVGPDRWSNPYNRELAALIREKMDACLDGIASTT